MDISIFDTGPVAVFVWAWDADDQSVHPLQFATPNCFSLLGYTKEELIAREVEYADRIHEDDIDRVVANIQKHASPQKDISFTDQYRIRKKSGEVIWVSDHSELKFTTNGTLKKITGYVSDITSLISSKMEAEQLKIERQAAERAAESKMQFLANMSHEIRTPMNGIIGLSDVLALTQLNDHQSKLVDTIQRSGMALVTIINDILDFSKIDAGQVELERAPFNLFEAIEDVVNLLSVSANDKDVDLLIKYAPDLPQSFVGDAGRIRQVLTNLLGNALKFTPSGHVLVDVAGETNNEKTSLSITIEDTGIGIPKNKREVIFEKFLQADVSTTREYGGTGLGLSISRELVNIMGGSITLESEVNVGSKFIIKIELPESDHNPVKSLDEPSVDLAGLNIVIVDDNQTNLDILKSYFKRWKVNVAAINTPHLALKFLNLAAKKSKRIDLIILDYHMPEMSGERLYQEILTRGLYTTKPIICLTSNHSDALKNRLSAAGINAVMTKPVTAEQLKANISKLLNLKPAPKQQIVENETPDKETLHSPDKDAPPLTDSNILIAEDNPINQVFYQHAMAELGYSYSLVENGHDAVEFWKRHKPELIIMDISMPKLNGYEATEAIRLVEKSKSLSRTAIIGASAHASKRHKEEALGFGMDDYITKPISLAQLKEKLGQYVLKSEGLSSNVA